MDTPGPAHADPQTLIAAPAAPPAEVIRQQQVVSDYTILRLAVLGLIVATVIALIGGVFLLSTGRAVPDGIIAIGSSSVGALATMLVRPVSPPPAIIQDRREQR